MAKKIYVVMASFNKGQSWTFCCDRGGGIIAEDMKRVAKYRMEMCYQRNRDECRKLGLKHFPRKAFKIVEFTQAEPQGGLKE